MKAGTLLLMVALTALARCPTSHQPAPQEHSLHKPRMPEAEVVAIAQRVVPLTENESYQATYTEDGIWRCWDEPHPGFSRITFKMVFIRDSDGSLMGITSFS